MHEENVNAFWRISRLLLQSTGCQNQQSDLTLPLFICKGTTLVVEYFLPIAKEGEEKKLYNIRTYSIFQKGDKGGRGKEAI
jgi:hypothetical protein